MPERVQKPFDPAPWGPKQGDEGGPRSPDISRPDTKDLLKKMRKVDPPANNGQAGFGIGPEFFWRE
ncbi:MAG: ubiquitin-like protein UBact [Verrucomicrobia bacterium]|nr:MAG: ubiquitin-like protein UBact [Verrucomicrobiota bacterium]